MDFDNDDYLDFSDDDFLVCTSRDALSSDDEYDFGLQDFPSRAVKKTRTKGTEIRKNTEDEFESEMMKELSHTMEEVTSFAKSKSGTKTEKESPIDGKRKHEPQCYDDVYFDSDEEDDEDHRNQRRLCTNDELLYDPNMDEQDQLWVDNRRRSYQVKRKNRLDPGKPQLLPQSDAVLNCPACLTTLCLDCQRHEKYTNQYRAMFVFNCKVDKTQKLSYPKKETKTERFKRIRQQRVAQRKAKTLQEKAPVGQEDQAKSEQETSTLDPAVENKEEQMDNFHPVLCTVCSTKVAVYDEDEVYHFFNIVTSY